MAAHYKPDENKKATEWTQYKENEKKWVIKAIALDVVWGSDQRYWKIPTNLEEPLELKQVAWLEVTYNIPLKSIIKLEHGKWYKVNFEVSIKQESAFGWSGSPVFLMVRVGSKKPLWRKADLSSLQKEKDRNSQIPADSTPLSFTFTEQEANSDNLTLGLYEIWKGRWRGGLLIHQVFITPTEPPKKK